MDFFAPPEHERAALAALTDAQRDAVAFVAQQARLAMGG